jgi:hypothetical protein
MTVIERERVVTETERRARVLEAAALEIEVRGWTQAVACDEGGRVCAMGALKTALAIDPAAYIGWAEAEQIVGAFGDDACWEMAGWNDEPDRTADEVTLLFRMRAEEIRSGR